MSLDTHVNVTLTVNNFGITRQGFGTIAFPTYKSLSGDPSRVYARASDAITDGFLASSPEVRFIQAVTAQTPKPPLVKLLHFSLPPTQRYVVSVRSVVSLKTYKINVKGEGVTDTACSFTSDGTALNDEIVAGLVTVLQAVVGRNYTAAATGAGGSQVVTITANAPGNWFSIEVLDTSLLDVIQNHADPGVATDLAAAQALDNDWYWLATTANSLATIEATALWIESAGLKAYIVDTGDSLVENQVAGLGDVADAMLALGYKRTLYGYHRKPNELWSSGWEGLLAAMSVGTWTAAYKQIGGSTGDKFTATQLAHLDAKKASYYKIEGGGPITWEGKVANASYGFLDVTVSLDFVLDDIQKSLFSLLRALAKMSYTDEDIAMARGVVLGCIDRAKSDTHKIVAKGTPGSTSDPVPTVTFPKVKDVDPSVRALRKLPNGAVNFRIQGAVHTIDVALTVTF